MTALTTIAYLIETNHVIDTEIPGAVFHNGLTVACGKTCPFVQRTGARFSETVLSALTVFVATCGPSRLLQQPRNPHQYDCSYEGHDD